MQVTIFKHIREVNTPFNIDVNYIFDNIKHGKVKTIIEQIRTEQDPNKKKNLKESLPSICFSGTFSRRSKSGLITHSGLACLDFDKFATEDELQKYRKDIIENEYTYACFISPSGDGLKVLVKIPPCTASEHEQYYSAICDLFDIDNIDSKTKDVSRVCFESYDPTIYINENSVIWDKKVENEPKFYRDINPTLAVTSTNEKITNLVTWGNKKFGIAKGGRNNNLFIWACAFNRFGIPKFEAESYFTKYAEADFSENEILRVIKQAYSNIAEFGTQMFEDKKRIDYIQRLTISGASKSDIIEKLDVDVAPEVLDELISEANVDVFWTKSKKGAISILNNKFREWLAFMGFYKYYPEHSDNFVFVYMNSNLIDNTNEVKLKDYVLDYLLKLDDISVYEYFSSKVQIFSDKYLSIAKNIDVVFKEDTKDTSYIYFNNGAIEVTKKGIKLVDYIDLDGFVWRKHIINKDYTKVSYKGCDFEKFVYNIAGKDEDKELSIRSTIGYLLHSYKNSAQNYAVILNDELISDNPNGGTGKGILINAISKLKRSAVIDGKTFSFDKSFPYQTVGVDTQIIVFDDVIRNFPFEKLFSIVTEGITIEKKNKDAIKIPVENSPKIIISTNYAIGGEGSSFERRKWEIELAQHYTMKNTPLQEFGRLLFDQWSDEEWMKFYNYMIDCLQLYLSEGLIRVEFTNSKLRKFIASTCMDFHNWMREEPFQLNERVDKKIMYDKFVGEYPDLKKIKQNTFSKWVKSWATYKDFDYTSDTSNGWQWFCIKTSEEVIINTNNDEDAPF
jgi:hypothetical protein